MKDESKIIVALDMDNTTIFSPRKFFFEDGKYSPQLRAIDRLGKHASFMTEKACELFDELTHMATVVPVTARSRVQYNRMVLPPESRLEYSVCSNGLEVTTPEGYDLLWENELRDIVKHSTIPLSQLKFLVFDSLHLKGLKPTKDKGNLVLSAHLPSEGLPEEFLEAMEYQLRGTGYNCSLQGMKINVYPAELSKDKGLNKIIEHIGKPEHLLIAGDSVMDLPIMEMADKCYYPADGEIRYDELPNGAYITKARGIFGGEEILQTIVNDVQNILKS